jgi:hypothetical protein
MKSNLLKYKFYASFIAILLFSNIGFAQEEEQKEEFDVRKYKPIYKFNSSKQSDNSRLLEVDFIVQNKKNRKDKIPVFEAEISFYNVSNDEELLLGTALTSKEGIAQLVLPSTQKYALDEDGFINLTARFKGTKGLKKAKKSLTVKDLQLELNLKEIDSVKTVLIEAYTIDSLQTKIPLEEADITIFVKGMLSNMPIKEGSIEDGVFEFEFPTDIPGDGDGDVTIIASIEDHDEFGNVIQEKFVNWGSHKITPVKKVKNTLWSESAPLWMYVVLTILLLGVWANYIYTIFNLFKIKKGGKSIKLATEE